MSQRARPFAFGDVALVTREDATLASAVLDLARAELERRLPGEATVWLRARAERLPGRPAAPTVELRAGEPIFEIGGVDSALAVEALSEIMRTLPLRCAVEQAPRD